MQSGLLDEKGRDAGGIPSVEPIRGLDSCQLQLLGLYVFPGNLFGFSAICTNMQRNGSLSIPNLHWQNAEHRPTGTPMSPAFITTFDLDLDGCPSESHAHVISPPPFYG